MATSILLLGEEDTLEPDDWVRPLQPTAGNCGGEPAVNSLATYSGTPLNHFKWVLARDVFGSVWFGMTLAEIHEGMKDTGGFNYEVVRGHMPRGHIWFWRALRERD